MRQDSEGTAITNLECAPRPHVGFLLFPDLRPNETSSVGIKGDAAAPRRLDRLMFKGQLLPARASVHDPEGLQRIEAKVRDARLSFVKA